MVGNNYVKKQMAFRDVKEPDVADDELYVYSTAPKVLSDEDEFDEEKIEEEEDEELPAPEEKTLDTDSNIPSTEFLWSFRCELTRGRSVTFISFNKHNEDIICISYGECKTNPNSSPGLVLCWSLKNPEWPERIYKSSSPVSAIDFSRSNSNLLAVGYVDGRIAIYDVRRKESASVLDNVGLLGKHRETVWELKWVEQERIRGDEQSRGENLVSISTDGRVTQWIIRKGLEFSGFPSV